MRVWDLPLRIFHWALVFAVIGAVVSSKADVMWLHERFGLSVMGLVAFRLIWGIRQSQSTCPVTGTTPHR